MTRRPSKLCLRLITRPLPSKAKFLWNRLSTRSSSLAMLYISCSHNSIENHKWLFFCRRTDHIKLPRCLTLFWKVSCHARDHSTNYECACAGFKYHCKHCLNFFSGRGFEIKEVAFQLGFFAPFTLNNSNRFFNCFLKLPFFILHEFWSAFFANSLGQVGNGFFSTNNKGATYISALSQRIPHFNWSKLSDVSQISNTM